MYIHLWMANVKTLAKELDFRTGGATRCQKLTGGMPPMPPALTEGLYAMRVSKMYILLGLEMLKVKIILGTLCRASMD